LLPPNRILKVERRNIPQRAVYSLRAIHGLIASVFQTEIFRVTAADHYMASCARIFDITETFFFKRRYEAHKPIAWGFWIDGISFQILRAIVFGVCPSVINQKMYKPFTPKFPHDIEASNGPDVFYIVVAAQSLMCLSGGDGAPCDRTSIGVSQKTNRNT